jgi:CubicO group peptidase (beta-lactamase class C family)
MKTQNPGRLCSVATSILGVRQSAPIFILALLTLALLLSCGSDSSNPTGSGIPRESNWETAPPEQLGFDPVQLEALTTRVYSGNLGRITSVLIVRDGYLVYEEYFRGTQSTDLVNVYSVTKSVSASLMGIAIDNGYIPDGVNARLFDYLEGYSLFPPGNNDSLYREALTLENLLTMRAGFTWDESSMPYGDPENSYNNMIQSDNWIQYTLNQSVSSQPGTEFAYNTGLSGLMAVVLEQSVGQRADMYADRKLFRKIGIDTCEWRMTPSGLPMTGSGLKMRPRDMAKFGWLFAQDGRWDGVPVVPEWWVQASHQAITELPDGRGYGYQWWLSPPLADEQDNPIRIPFALGWGGQHILVVPVYGLVIVVTADDDQSVSGSPILEIMERIGAAFTPTAQTVAAR